MRAIVHLRARAALLAATIVFSHASMAAAEHWAEARAASCEELVDAYKETVAAERKVVAAIQATKSGTVATNVVGAAAMLTLGFGFFTWNNSVSDEENLADLRNDLHIIRTVSAEKKCALPAASDIK